FKAEGEASIDAFLQRQGNAKGARRLPAPGHLLPLADNGEASADSYAAAASDGFFYALIEKADR
ncbi:MAG: 16S rRNA (cytosine(967)-C(5))-methyltransferase RsmB, partial [Burkholderiales bacterium]